MRRAINVLDFRVTLNRHLEIELLDRVRRVPGSAQRKQKVGQSLVLAAQLRVTERHRALGSRRHGEDAGLEHAGADPLQQRRIAILANDFFVEPPRLAGSQEFGRMLLAVDQQRQLVDRSVVRQWKDEADLHRHATGVDERLRDLRARHLIGQLDLDRQLLDLVGAWHDRARCGIRMGIKNVRSRQGYCFATINIDQKPLSLRQTGQEKKQRGQ